MAWTSPRTWVAGETLTAANMNTHVRDNLNYLYDPGDWVSYTPTVSGFTSVVTTTSGYYQYLNASTIMARMTVTVGTVTTLGSATITVSLPVNQKTTGQVANLSPIGTVVFDPNGATTPAIGSVVYVATGTCGVLLPNATAPRASTWTGAVPASQAAGDVWYFQVQYEAA